MSGYYLQQYNFSVRLYNGQWCMFTRCAADQVASSDEQISAVEAWAASNHAKFASAR